MLCHRANHVSPTIVAIVYLVRNEQDMHAYLVDVCFDS